MEKGKRRTTKFLTICLFLGILMSYCGSPAVSLAGTLTQETEVSGKSREMDLSDAVTVVVRGTTLSVSKGNKALTVDKWAKKGVEYDGQILTLDKGVFILSGELEGQLVVKAGKKSERRSSSSPTTSE